MSLYIDDVTFSFQSHISKKTREKLIKEIESYGYKINKEKVKYSGKEQHKKITGVILSKRNKIRIPNNIRKEVIDTDEEIDKQKF